MNENPKVDPATLALIGLGIDVMLKLWASHANKPAGWIPTPDDWAQLRAAVVAATPDAELELAKERLNVSTLYRPAQ